MGLFASKSKARGNPESPISRPAIENWVDNYLSTEGCNMVNVPDFIERSVYISVLTMILAQFASKGKKTITLEVMGHKIEIDVKTSITKT